MNLRDKPPGEMRGWRPRTLRPSICPHCKQKVIWARIKGPPRSGKRAFIPFPIDRCEAGTGDYALSIGLFTTDEMAPLAEQVSNGTSYRSHREHCTALPTKTPVAARAATKPKSFSATSFKHRVR